MIGDPYRDPPPDDPRLAETRHWAELRRYEDRKEMRVLAGLDCGHMQSYVIDERAVAAARGPVDEIALLDRIVDQTERGCQCVRRLELA